MLMESTLNRSKPAMSPDLLIELPEQPMTLDESERLPVYMHRPLYDFACKRLGFERSKKWVAIDTILRAGIEAIAREQARIKTASESVVDS